MPWRASSAIGYWVQDAVATNRAPALYTCNYLCVYL